MSLELKILGGCIIASSFYSCSRLNDKEKSTAINFPNKSSELAELMRDLVENTEEVKLQISKNEKPGFFIEFDKLHTAVPTDLAVRDDGHFTSFANNYIATVNELINTTGDKEEKYNKMIQSCIICHQQICPGPIKRIKKLRIK
ncbi:MAG: hypothetical protein CMD16_05305 [Flavobacteriales bacterium]|nr:hypothetical protein [Flavobacteriales bacterium]|tara:strand:- start:4830 stop:5261 length:432 start_codon:yes stop_codon:yes gene_type:complete